MTDLGKSSSPARNHPFNILSWTVHCNSFNWRETTQREHPQCKNMIGANTPVTHEKPESRLAHMTIYFKLQLINTVHIFHSSTSNFIRDQIKVSSWHSSCFLCRKSIWSIHIFCSICILLWNSIHFHLPTLK